MERSTSCAGKPCLALLKSVTTAHDKDGRIGGISRWRAYINAALIEPKRLRIRGCGGVLFDFPPLFGGSYVFAALIAAVLRSMRAPAFPRLLGESLDDFKAGKG